MKLFSTIVLAALGGVSANGAGHSVLSANPELRRKLVAAHRSNSIRHLAVSEECAAGNEELMQDDALLAEVEALPGQCPDAISETSTSMTMDFTKCPDDVLSDLKETCEGAGGAFTEPMTIRIKCSLDRQSFEVVTTLNECLHPSCDFDNYVDQLDDVMDDPEMKQAVSELESLGMTCTVSSAAYQKIGAGILAAATVAAAILF